MLQRLILVSSLIAVLGLTACADLSGLPGSPGGSGPGGDSGDGGGSGGSGDGSGDGGDGGSGSGSDGGGDGSGSGGSGSDGGSGSGSGSDGDGSDGPGDGGPGPGGPGPFAHIFSAHGLNYQSVSVMPLTAEQDLPQFGAVSYTGSVRFDLAGNDEVIELVGDALLTANFGMFNIIDGTLQNFYTEDHQIDGVLNVMGSISNGGFFGLASGGLSNDDTDLSIAATLAVTGGEFVSNAGYIRALIGGNAQIDGISYSAEGEMAAQANISGP